MSKSSASPPMVSIATRSGSRTLTKSERPAFSSPLCVSLPPSLSGVILSNQIGDPIVQIADADRKVSVLYDMLDQQDATNIDQKGLPFTVRPLSSLLLILVPPLCAIG